MGWNEESIPGGKERLFEEILFMGSGKRSIHRRDVLLQRVKEAVYALGALQQPGHPISVTEEQEDQEVRERLTQFIEGVVEDVVMALTGEEWEHHKKEPKPKRKFIVELDPGDVAYTRSTTMTTNSDCYSAPYGPYDCKIVRTEHGWEWVGEPPCLESSKGIHGDRGL